MAIRRSVPLLAILFAVTAGLFGMHTLGHEQPTSPMAMAQQVEHTLDGVMAVTGGPSTHGMPDGLAATCLAILAAALAIAVLLFITLGTHAAYGASHHTWAGSPLGRGPPPTRLGQRLAEASVLRN